MVPPYVGGESFDCWTARGVSTGCRALAEVQWGSGMSPRCGREIISAPFRGDVTNAGAGMPSVASGY
ncbi:MAG: hypothetical protein MJ014_03035 [Methanocorpusculum sp.]|nr:hypothetical protein [Methanocorpusculum sp.]